MKTNRRSFFQAVAALFTGAAAAKSLPLSPEFEVLDITGNSQSVEMMNAISARNRQRMIDLHGLPYHPNCRCAIEWDERLKIFEL